MTAAAATSRGRPPPTGLASKPWWPWLKRAATLLFFSLVAWLLVRQGRAIEWDEVLTALRAYPVGLLAGAVALAALSFTLYSCFDLVGRHYTGHTLRVPTVMLVTFISYVFNLNLGSLVGGVAFRYRLYSRLHLDTGTITRVMSLSMLTNWIGYLLLGGLIFSLATPELPPTWAIGSDGLHLVGFALLAGAAAYLALCAFSRQRNLTVRGETVQLPSGRVALLQVLMGASNWLIMSGVMFLLLQQKVDLPTVAGVLLVAAVAGVLTHVPGGLGVLEAVFVALLSHTIPTPQLLAALVAYRVIYYLVPLALATLAFGVMEARARSLAVATRQRSPG